MSEFGQPSFPSPRMNVDAPGSTGRLPRRFLLTAGAGAAAAAVTGVVAPSAAASTATTPWVCGGNSGITTDGTNFLGTKNAAPLIFKTTSTTAGATPAERMRITPTGPIGINTTAPTASLDVRGNTNTLRALNTSTSTSAAGLLASATKGSAVSATSTDGSGVVAASTNKYGVSATSTNSVGVYAQGGAGAYGVQATSPYSGVYASGTSYGAICEGSGGSGYGLYSHGNYLGSYSTGGTYGAYGVGPTGVYGSGTTGVAGTGSTNGVTGTVNSGAGRAVWGNGGQYGVFGSGGSTAGVRGESGYVGVWGQAPSFGVYALATDTGTAQTYGVYAQCSNSKSFAVYANGNVAVNGTLSKSAGSFKIDHPQDPEHQWLSHSFVESPDMMNVYNGNVVLDQNGSATVQLPAYFGALNREFRYQLTPIGAFAPVFVSAEIKDNAFGISGGTAGLKVSWQVTGIRQDAYAAAHPIVVETPKSGADRGQRQFGLSAANPADAANAAGAAHRPTAADSNVGATPPAAPIAEPQIRRP